VYFTGRSEAGLKRAQRNVHTDINSTSLIIARTRKK